MLPGVGSGRQFPRFNHGGLAPGVFVWCVVGGAENKCIRAFAVDIQRNPRTEIRMSYSNLLTTGLLAGLLSVEVAAGVIERDWLAPGDGLITFDTVNQREWLDLTVTQGESLEGVASELLPGGRYHGFVHAETQDVIDLAASAGVNVDCIPRFEDEPLGLQNLVGITDHGSFLFIWSGGVSLASDGTGYNQVVFYSHDDGPCMNLNVDDYLVDPSIPDDSRGMWLYRPVPEPSGLESMTLVVVFAITLLARSRRKCSRLVRSTASRCAFSPVPMSACLLLILAFTTRATLAQSRVVNVEITSPSLEGNVVGDPATRTSRVYLPSSYDENSTQRYPVVYYLHGGGGDENALFSKWRAHRTADRLIDAGTMDELILVSVDATTSYAGTNYTNSALLGKAEDFIVEDVVSYVDNNFRTIADRDSRGLIGASSGGNAALRYAMLRSDVYGGVATTSAGIYNFSHPEGNLYLGGESAEFSQRVLDAAKVADPGAVLATVEDIDDVRDSTAEGYALIRLVYNWAGSLSPNLESPRWADLPFEAPGLEIIPKVRDLWYEFDLYHLLEDHAEELSALRGLSIDVGNLDSLTFPDNQTFHEALVDMDIDHQFEVFTGRHSDKRATRIEEALKFLSDRLVVSSLDLNKDGSVESADIDLLCTAITAVQADLGFDLNLDNEVSALDVAFFLDEYGTSAGDANLDGAIAFDDFLILSSNFGASEEVLWSTGDFDCSGGVEFADFLLLSANFGQGVAVRPVPEPRPGVLISFSTIFTIFLTRRHSRHKCCWI